MILVLLGTNLYDFGRLITAVDTFAQTTEEPVEMQLGRSVTQPEFATFFSFLPTAELEEKIRAARLVITQGGYGSIYDCLRLKKKVIAVPRLREKNEAQDAGLGQTELVQYLESKRPPA